MRVVISSGFGRLHFAECAEWIAKSGIDVSLIMGWCPDNPNSAVVRIASKIVGRDLSAGFKKRIASRNYYSINTCSLSEFVENLARIFCKLTHLSSLRFAHLTWRFFGFQSKKFLKNADVFHVRSGAGHGGAIKKAREIGMKILVDHSIAHPAYMERHLRDEYERNNTTFDLGISSTFWQLVDEDCQWADLILVNSDFVKRTFVENGYNPDKIRVAYLGVRKDFIGLREKKAGGRISFLFTGGFTFRKGAEYIMEAVRMLKDRVGDAFVLDVYGDVSAAQSLRESYKKYDLPIIFHGPVPQDDLKSALASADVYVFPSLSEGCAKSGMEAMSAGICTIATIESGLPIEDGETGRIVKSGNSSALYEVMHWAIDNPDEIDRLGHNAMVCLRDHYSWESYAEKVGNIYQELVRR